MAKKRPTRRLIEVSLPLDEINAAGRAEKSVPRKGLPATMHLWWSRKPVGVARAVIFASLVDDPEDDPARRRHLMDLVADLARWDCPTQRLAEAADILHEQHAGSPPKVIDPFCGGGAIPYGAATLGLAALGIDLNPVAALTTKAIVEIPGMLAGLGPVHASARGEPVGDTTWGPRDLAHDVASYGRDLLDDVHARISGSYPPATTLGGTASNPVSYLWARTCRCANPDCRGEIIMLSTWWLARRPPNQWHVRPVVDHATRTTRFEVVQGPKPDSLADLKAGTGASFRCLHCGEVTDTAAIRAHGVEEGFGLRLVAIQVHRDPQRPRSGRAWTNATEAHELAATHAGDDDTGLAVRSYEIPEASGNITKFGIRTVADLLTPRQAMLMSTMCASLDDLRSRIRDDALAAGLVNDDTALHEHGRGATAYADAVTTYLALTISRMANRVSTMTIHNRSNGSVEQSFVQPGYAFYGEFAEADPFSGSTGSFANSLEHVTRALAQAPVDPDATVLCGPAVDELRLVGAEGATGVVCTDPPYYDMFDYAALSELFYPWIRLTLADIWPELTATTSAPRDAQVIADHARFDGDRDASHRHFEISLAQTLVAIREIQDDATPFTLFYGYRDTGARGAGTRGMGRSRSAWEALLGALVSAGVTVTATWSLRTERPEGVKSSSNALGSSILLVCRTRVPEDAPTTQSEFVEALEARITDVVAQLQQRSIAPVDLAQAAMGEGIAVFTSMAAAARGGADTVAVSDAIDRINEAIDRAIHIDATGTDPATRWATTWFADHAHKHGPLERAQALCNSVGTSMDELARTGIITAESDRIQLVGHGERSTVAPDDDPTDEPVWCILQRITMSHRSGDGDTGISHPELSAQRAQAVRSLAYRLYALCASKGMAREARIYNSVITSWPTTTVS